MTAPRERKGRRARANQETCCCSQGAKLAHWRKNACKADRKAESAKICTVAPSLRVSWQTRFLFSMEAELILEGSHCGLGEISFV